MKIKEIQNLIKFVAKSGAQEVKLEMEDVKITIKTGSAPSQIESGGLVQQIQAVPTPIVSQIPVQTAPITQQEPPKNEEKTGEDDKFITIKSPIIGTFYRKAAPDKPAFVEVGDTIKEGGILCVIEAMKLFNEIESEVSGTIVKILIDDATPVEFDQPLFLINPS
jgi:acetyl-CoA carboxylase biotin carboxyl carrier protein